MDKEWKHFKETPIVCARGGSRIMQVGKERVGLVNGGKTVLGSGPKEDGNIWMSLTQQVRGCQEGIYC